MRKLSIPNFNTAFAMDEDFSANRHDSMFKELQSYEPHQLFQNNEPKSP